ncbi:MAG: hypothetical protein ACM3UU_06635 [Ignavibacteriales bacterium]
MNEDVKSVDENRDIVEIICGKLLCLEFEPNDETLKLFQYHTDKLLKAPIFFAFFAKEWLNVRGYEAKITICKKPSFLENIFAYLAFKLAKFAYDYMGTKSFD